MLKNSMHELVSLKKKTIFKRFCPLPLSPQQKKKNPKESFESILNPCDALTSKVYALIFQRKLEKNLILGPFWVLFGSLSSKKKKKKKNFLGRFQNIPQDLQKKPFEFLKTSSKMSR